MPTDKQVRLAQFTFILNGMLFLLGGTDLLSSSKLSLGMLQLVASVSNFSLLLPFRSKRSKARLNFLVLAMNIIVASSVAVDYFQSGKQYIQYAWIIAALFSMVALIIQFRKRKNTA